MDSRSSIDQVRILFALAGLHRVDRGAEVAIISVARELAKLGNLVTLMGSGPPRPGEPYRYIQVPAVSRTKFEAWPSIPTLRNDTSWEEATFVPGLLARYRPANFDITATCAFPWTSWALRRPVLGRRKPRHVFITQNGDWPAVSHKAEFRFFGCDGLVCTNPDYFERNSGRYRCALIPNGVDLERFHPGPSERERLGLPSRGPIVLMVSALIASKNVAEGIEAVAKVPDAQLVVAGDGPLRDEIHALAAKLLPGRFSRLTLPASDMPALYRSADVFMHLSVDESFGNVFVEALASGLPIVAYDTPRTRWIIGDEGLLAKREAAEGLATELARALQKKRNSAASQRAQGFGWPKIASQYDQFFREMME
jgi:glycosyltransferase involved in cell wall biosynthesis